MDSASTSRAIGVGALVLLSITVLLTLIQHPIFTLALILILLWLFLHPQDAENLWRSAVPALTEAFAKAVQEAGASTANVTRDVRVGKDGGRALSNSSGCNSGDFGCNHVTAPAQDKIRGHQNGEDPNFCDQNSKPRDKVHDFQNFENSKSAHPSPMTQAYTPIDDPLLALDSLAALDDDEGDIEIEPLDTPLDRPDLLKPVSAHLNSAPRPDPPPKPRQNQILHDQKQPAAQPNAHQYSNGTEPDVIIMNAPAPHTYKRQFGAGEDEFYVTSVDYEHFEFEPLIITEQVPKTTEWFEQLGEKQKVELMKEQAMRERLSRSMSRAPTDMCQ